MRLPERYRASRHLPIYTSAAAKWFRKHSVPPRGAPIDLRHNEPDCGLIPTARDRKGTLMVRMETVYNGGTRCTLTHQSGASIETAAPTDIGGTGDRFSPTDLVGAALASCILTTLAMWAERQELSLNGASAAVTKEMRIEPPRRIGRLVTTVTVPAGTLPPEHRERAEQIARACPVHKSLHPEIEAPIEFVYE